MESRRYLTTPEAAAYLGLSRRTLETLRLRGNGPEYSAPRGHRRIVRYLREDLDTWMVRRSSTSDRTEVPGRVD